MSLSYVIDMYGVFNNYVHCLTEYLFKSDDIPMSFATLFNKKSYIFTTQMKPLHSLFNSYVYLSCGLKREKWIAFK